jgi:hypothetical protein
LGRVQDESDRWGALSSATAAALAPSPVTVTTVTAADKDGQASKSVSAYNSSSSGSRRTVGPLGFRAGVNSTFHNDVAAGSEAGRSTGNLSSLAGAELLGSVHLNGSSHGIGNGNGNGDSISNGNGSHGGSNGNGSNGCSNGIGNGASNGASRVNGHYDSNGNGAVNQPEPHRCDEGGDSQACTMAGRTKAGK